VPSWRVVGQLITAPAGVVSTVEAWTGLNGV
jgi:hypothetical protein